MSTNENVDKQGRPRRRRIRWWMIALALLIAFLTWNYWPRDPEPIIIGPDTTYVDGPLREDGTVDYVAHLNQKYSQGVTPENNAAPLLVKFLGADSDLSQRKRDLVLNAIGLTEADIEDSPTFVAWDERHVLLRPDQPPPQQWDEKTYLFEVIDGLDEGKVHADLKLWLEANAEAIALVERASRRERYFIPLVSEDGRGLISCLLPMPPIRKVAEALGARAELRIREGDLEGAWNDVLTMHRLARLAQQGPVLIDQLIALAIENEAAKVIHRLASRGLTPEMGRQMLDQLRPLKPVGRTVQTLDEFERLSFLSTLNLLYRSVDELPGSEPSEDAKTLFDWNDLFRRANRMYDQVVAAASDPDLAGPEIASISDEEAELKMKLPTGRIGKGMRTNALWDQLSSLLCPSVRRAAALEDVSEAHLELEKLAVALAVYKHDNGQYPDELDELSPDYLAEIPADPFSGKPLIYYPDELGYVLYSVGLNGKDDGGINDHEEVGDIAVGVPFERVQPAEKEDNDAVEDQRGEK